MMRAPHDSPVGDPIDYVERALWRLDVVHTLAAGAAHDPANSMYRADFEAIGDSIADIAAELRDEHDVHVDDALPTPVRDALTVLLAAVREAAVSKQKASRRAQLRLVHRQQREAQNEREAE